MRAVRALGLALAVAVLAAWRSPIVAQATDDPDGSPSVPAAASEAPPPEPGWVKRGTAELQALDKVNARSAALTVKVGDSVQYGSLTIAVQSCVVRPPDQPQDAAAFLVITDSHQGEPGFRGWMFASAPSVSMLEHPIYDVRVLGCHA